MTRKRTSPESPGTTDESPDRREARGAGGSFPIVGIGASAGGLEAFTSLLEHLPADTGMGFVLVQHLDPQHDSALTQILSGTTSLPVREAADELQVERDHVYVITPDTSLGIAEGVLKVQTRVPHRPVDAFFEALAQDQRERAIGVVLSGTASDGTLGLEAIKGEGGITFAQDDSAKHDSMPRSAVAAGCVDFVLSPQHIAQELARIAAHPYIAGQSPELLTPAEDDATTAHDDQSLSPSGGRKAPRTSAKRSRAEAERGRGPKRAEDGYKKILLLLRNHCGVDFSLYKSSTLQRRITRRLVLSKQTTLEDYARSLQDNTKELDALYSDVLINVTGFFRNPEAFDVLQRKVLPELLQQPGDDPLRAWVLGCSTGQEAYSLAIAFAEATERAPRMRELQVFATDLNAALLEKARRGLYPKSLTQEITPERLRRFFVEEEGGYRVSKALRERVVFARQNLISDPPFSRMDLISCRNLLIYLEPSLQKKTIPTLHYALKPERFLLLGASESIGGFTDLFEPVDKKYKIYVKKAAPGRTFQLPLRKEREERTLPPLPAAPSATAEGLRGELNAQREADRVVANRFAPPGVLVNDQLQVLQFRGPTGAYLTLPSGKAGFDLLEMARDGLMLPLRAAINHARKENQTARKDNVRVKHNDETRAVDVEVIPLNRLQERYFLVLFEEADESSGGRQPPAHAARLPGGEASGRMAEFNTELSERTRDYLQSMQEQYEAANEEIQSTNEELWTINEELERSTEELEAANKELADRNSELNRLNNDLLNLQTSTRLAIIQLARDLTIRRFSTQAEKQFGLLISDVGRPIGHVRHNLVLDPAASETSAPDLESLVGGVIASVREKTFEVRDQAGRWYSLRVSPYLTLDSEVDGAVLVLVDITEHKRAEEASVRLAAIVASSDDAIISKNLNGIIQTWNAGAQRIFGYTAQEAIGQPVTMLIPWDYQDEEPAILERIRRGERVDHYETIRRCKDGTLVDIALTISPILDAQGRISGASKIARDISERKRMERRIAQQAKELTDMNRRKDEFLAMLSHELRNPMAPIFNALEMIGQTGGESALQHDARGVIERQMRHMARLVDDLLDVSRITTGRIRLRIERVDVNDVIERAVERVRHIIDRRGQQLSISLAADGIVWLDADSARLEQVVGNLLDNASKYSHDGGRIALSVEQSDGEAIIRVRDDGGGIAADALPRVFDLFSQADQSLSRSQGGLGIGLALVKNLIELHRGTVKVHSEGIGQGSEFVVCLPLALGTQAQPAETTAVPPATAIWDSRLRVLIVDDNADAAKMSALLLRSWGHEVRVAYDGPGALQRTAGFHPHVILLDIGLPDMDGYEVARLLRQDPQFNDVRIVAVTGYGQDADRQRAKQAGCDEHLVKPVEAPDLKALLGRFQEEMNSGER